MPSVELKNYKVMSNGQNFFAEPVINNIRTNKNILKITTGEGDDHTTDCLIFYPYLNNY